MEKFNFKNRIQSNPRLLRLKNPTTGEIIDYEIQDLQESEIVENGTEMTAEVLNTMQSNIEESCVAVSPTQPETGEKVWIQKGKNLFDKEDTFTGYWLNNSGGLNITPDAPNNLISNYIKVKPNTNYIISRTNSSNWRMVCAYDKNKVFTSIILNSDTNLSFVTGNDDYYIRLSLNSGTEDIDSIQVEQGSTATEYEAYVKKKIKTKNSNGEFETIYDENDLTELQERPNPANYGIGGQCKVVTGDWNTACKNDTGFYMGQGLENSPSDFWLFVIHLVHNESWAKQIAMPLNTSNILMRTKTEGIWSAWTQLH